ncbi:hypothetical protein FOMPIDRAFT_114524 [Fomitopsis schrenkii]|uniref:Uncharacterized protein n=1 Tax=Fomitopsis schrenkii TaxID=2126942 RepID=S8DT34_FOMSC|nr:hypothetical protein FOMPIDRAFT_114524 [Fomitopsis schrenkii]
MSTIDIDLAGGSREAVTKESVIDCYDLLSNFREGRPSPVEMIDTALARRVRGNCSFRSRRSTARIQLNCEVNTARVVLQAESRGWTYDPFGHKWSQIRGTVLCLVLALVDSNIETKWYQLEREHMSISASDPESESSLSNSTLSSGTTQSTLSSAAVPLWTFPGPGTVRVSMLWPEGDSEASVAGATTVISDQSSTVTLLPLGPQSISGFTQASLSAPATPSRISEFLPSHLVSVSITSTSGGSRPQAHSSTGDSHYEIAVVSGSVVTIAALCILGGMLWHCRRRGKRHGGEKNIDELPVRCSTHEPYINSLGAARGGSSADASTTRTPMHAFIGEEQCENGEVCMPLGSRLEAGEVRTHTSNVPYLPTSSTGTAMNPGSPRTGDANRFSLGDVALAPSSASVISSPPSFTTEPSVTAFPMSFNRHLDSGFRFHPTTPELPIPPTQIRVVDLPPAYTED